MTTYAKWIDFGNPHEKDYEERKKYIEHMMEQRSKDRESLCVIYNPDCGCRVDHFVVLDRYPMSEKIHSQCALCKKGCLFEITHPIIFHQPMMNEDYTLDQLKEMVVTDTWQAAYIHCYQEFGDIKPRKLVKFKFQWFKNMCEWGYQP